MLSAWALSSTLAASAVVRSLIRGAFLLALNFGVASYAAALEKPETELPQASVSTKLGTQIDIDRSFRSSSGEEKPLRDFMLPGRPAIIMPVYFNCARMCSLTLNGMSKALNELDLGLGEDFQVIAISFDPTETAELADERAELLRSQYRNPDQAKSGWQFLVGNKENVELIMQQLGFHYIRDKGEFAHAAAVMLLTPSGQISQYFTGIEFPAKDLRLALVEASQGRIGNVIDHVMLFCFRFDQTKGRYTWAAFNLMRAGGALTLLLLGSLIVYLWRREKR